MKNFLCFIALMLLAFLSMGDSDTSHNPEEAIATNGTNRSVTINLTDMTFENYTRYDPKVLSNPWFIMFYAPWCPHCNRLKPIWEEVALLFEGEINFAFLDADSNPRTKNKFRVKGYPTIYFLHENKTRKYEGFRNKENITFFAYEGWKHVPAEDMPSGEEEPMSPLLMGVLATFMIFVLVAMGLLVWTIAKDDATPNYTKETDPKKVDKDNKPLIQEEINPLDRDSSIESIESLKDVKKNQ